ncbi:hypothetical protein BZA70DRAFT_18259 [Myxozyma melibiosi]|uniref:Cenp-O kinetochore centromere component n=1 Tax=Myxozyma melibiosi TaxID=54550 RepID=A0ABR1FCG2_9ASCO
MSSTLDRYRVEIGTLHLELSTLARKRALLAAKLAQLQSDRAVLLTSSDLPSAEQATLPDTYIQQDRPRGRDLLAHISAKHGQQQEIHLKNLYRLTGVTAFSVQDPVAKEELLGIRIECFALKSFGAPHYIILSHNEKTGTYQIYQHTVPLHIPLGTLASKYLNKNLNLFVRAVRRHIIWDLNKRTHLSCLSRVVDIEADEACELIKLRFEFPDTGERFVYLRCDDTHVKSAYATRVVARENIEENEEEEEEEEEEVVRDRELEKLMIGRIDRLRNRLAAIK